MERGLFWLPLLVIFFWLAWMGWSEYQKIEAYRRWAEPFDRAKYDIYAVLGQTGKTLIWGKPTRSGPIDLQSFSLDRVRDIRLLVDKQPVTLESLPTKGKPAIEFSFDEPESPIQIPFTEISLAAQWTRYLQEQLKIVN
ncbi:MAG: hypothetical protein IGR93_20475 [Hydrococcus sp. C42_A2020_068]|uniref:hypothetical protein n=1 Tax=Pleurocapsa sp. PCC 7327 TaxID=118163 RepID=UPI00029FE1A3|nr:hypothetical protein [Pleurocapsa sp. PCC 7327]AFY77051.1 hypothetical protein Ple7327_1689 [Pleurocapsa sp. PCC 7327]MBF2022399.1 hypothetical protein [Hydrococcus sp. C42_A2020_068]